jgi:hypothetical protein
MKRRPKNLHRWQSIITPQRNREKAYQSQKEFIIATFHSSTTKLAYPPPPQNVKRKDQKGGLFGQKLWKSRTNPIKIQKELCLMSTKRLDPAKPNATTESRQPYTKNNSG